MSQPIHERRIQLGLGAVFAPSEAAELLPMGYQRAMHWLRQRGLVRLVEGAEVVVWLEVVDALRTPVEPQRAVVRNLPRAGLTAG